MGEIKKMTRFDKLKSFFANAFFSKTKEVQPRQVLMPVLIGQIQVDKLYWIATTMGYYSCRGGRMLGSTGRVSTTTIQSLHKGFVFATEQDAKAMYERLMSCRDVK